MGAQVETSCAAKPRCCVAAAKLENTVPGGVVLPLPPLDAAVPFGLAPPETFQVQAPYTAPRACPDGGPAGRLGNRDPRTLPPEHLRIRRIPGVPPHPHACILVPRLYSGRL